MNKLFAAAVLAAALAGCASVPPADTNKYNLVLTWLQSGDESPYVGVPGGKTTVIFPNLDACKKVLAAQQDELANLQIPPFKLACKVAK